MQTNTLAPRRAAVRPVTVLQTDQPRIVLAEDDFEMRRLVAQPLSKVELRRAQDYLIGQMELQLESTENQMNWVGESLFGHGKIVPPAEARDRIAAVTASEVRAVARDFFRPERLTLALVSTLEKSAGLEKLLRW